MGSLWAPLKILHVPKADDKNGIFVVPGVPTIEICVLPSRAAGSGITNSPTDLTSKGPAGGKMTGSAMMRSSV